ncbi:MAG: glycosyltransferase family 4 protein [Micrococcales bacterium]
MHILVFLDQSPHSLGGVQASVLLQQKYLEKAGHRVTLVAPASSADPVSTPGCIVYPSFALTPNREYTATANLGKAYQHVLNELAAMRANVDVVHVQADWWGALLGAGFAKRQNLPLVNTLHTNLTTGAAKVVGSLGAGFLYLLHSEVFGRWVLGRRGCITGDGWKYLRLITSTAHTVIAPSQHFAQLAKEHQVAQRIEVVPTGVDDDSVTLGARPATTDVTFAWSGRFSNEKRAMEFLQALRIANLPAKARIYGSGALQKKMQRFIEASGLGDRVTIVGRVSHQQMIQELANAQALVQTSIGFETQGMTVFEAGVVGTPSVLCDWNIADDLPANSYWKTADNTVEALAETLTEAYRDLSAGVGKHIDLSGSMLQSRLYAESLRIYERAIAEHS